MDTGTRTRSGRIAAVAGAVAAVAATGVASLAIGARSLPPGQVYDALFHYDPGITGQAIVHDLRIPRTLLALAVGGALGLAGAVMQGITRNPLADPGLLGVNAGASLAVVTAITAVGVTSPSGYVWFAFGGAAIAALVVYGLGSVGDARATPVKLAIAGAAVAALLGSITSGILLVDAAALNQFRFWAVGSVAGRDLAVSTAVAPSSPSVPCSVSRSHAP